MLKRWVVQLRGELGRFREDARGQIAIIFAISSLAILLGLGASVDLARAYSARQKLSEVATLACQYSTRPSVVQTGSSTYTGSNGFQTYVSAVNAFATTSLASQSWPWPTPTGASGSQGAYFTATAPSGGSTTPSNPSVTMAANVPTALMQLAHITQIPVQATINCQSVTVSPQIVNPGYVLQEGFETPCTSYCFTSPSGASGTTSTPTQSFPATAGYTGSAQHQWYIVGYCLETDVTGVINATSPEGSHTAELDCDNGRGTAGNSSISTKVYLADGSYELRYNYRSRIDYPDYDPTYVCGTTATDLSWANDTNFSLYQAGSVSRTNQINVYLDMNTSGTAPLHLTLDGTQHLAGANLIDECVYSPTWVERSVRITVTTPAYYWVSFAADGQSDSYGGQLDNIRLCPDKCAAALQDNFPSAWLPTGGGSTPTVLFEDTFASPSYTNAYAPYTNTAGNLNLSKGTSGTSSSGWPSLPASGWATAPYNQATYVTTGAYTGTSQYVLLDGHNTGSSTATNRLISRPFLLDPGYYQVTYNYISMWNVGAYGPYCFSNPASGTVFGTAGSATGTIRYGGTLNTNTNTNTVGVFMSNGLLVSTPIGGGALNAQTSYNNPDGTVSTTPKVAPDAVNWQSYDATAVNPVLDVCAYVGSYAWMPRTAALKITKPGLYWLSFSSQSAAADSTGGAIDDVKLTALGSLYSTAPATPTTIPVPTPQPDTTFTNSGAFIGFSIVADPQTPPGGP